MAVPSASLRGPLVPIIGFVQRLQRDLPARHRSHGYAAEIESAAAGLPAVPDALPAAASGRALPPEIEPKAVAAAGDTLRTLRTLRTLLETSRNR